MGGGHSRPHDDWRERQERERQERERHEAEERRRQAEEAARQAEVARQRAAEEARHAEEQRRQAEERRREAEETTRRVEEEKRRMEEERRHAEEERKRREEERKRAEEARRRAEEAARVAEEARRRAEEEQRRVAREQAAAERAKAEAERMAREARALQEEAERRLREGNRPIIVPEEHQVLERKKRLKFEGGKLHIAVAGISGSGKSSLINALRGLRNGDPGAAPAGVIETTSEISRYPDPDLGKRVVWYDVPGAGTLAIPDWVYFTDQGLYVFDRIIVLFDMRFTATDVAILRNCARFQIPAYIVRSKARQHIRNLAQDLAGGGGSDDEEESSLDDAILIQARERYVRESRDNVKNNLEQAGLPQQRAYIVDKQPLAQLIKGGRPRDQCDEQDLLRDLFAATRS